MTDSLPEADADSLPTLQSLPSRLRDWGDQAGWHTFFDSYWRLIYHVARKSGLNDAEAQDVVQNTFVYLSRRMPGFHYDPTRGSFKSWLRVVTRSRISEFLRREKGSPQAQRQEPRPGMGDPELDELPDPASDCLDEIWQREWEENLVNTALRRVRAKVSSQQLLIFRLAALGDLSLNQGGQPLAVCVENRRVQVWNLPGVRGRFREIGIDWED